MNIKNKQKPARFHKVGCSEFWEYHRKCTSSMTLYKIYLKICSDCWPMINLPDAPYLKCKQQLILQEKQEGFPCTQIQ